MTSTKAQPLVSTAIPTLNRAGFVREAVGSALAQTHGNVEVIVPDNGSIDDTPAVLAALAADSRFGRRSPCALTCSLSLNRFR